MSLSRTFVISCDAEGCGEQIIIDPSDQQHRNKITARALAKDRGWAVALKPSTELPSQTDVLVDLCREHKRMKEREGK